MSSSSAVAGNHHFSQSMAVIDLNNGAQAGNGTIRQVLVTPIAPGVGIIAAMPHARTHQSPKVSPIDKVFLKAISNENSKDAKTFTLRHIDTTQVSDSDDLKELIKDKLGGD